jgi:hypothetical protein
VVLEYCADCSELSAFLNALGFQLAGLLRQVMQRKTSCPETARRVKFASAALARFGLQCVARYEDNISIENVSGTSLLGT